MGSSELKDKAAKGIFWGGFSNGAQQFLNLVFGIFLARLLSPGDYGVIGMLSIFTLIAGSIQDSGFSAALINEKDDNHDSMCSVFWFNITMSLVLYLILFFCAPLIARFYHNPELVILSRYLFISLFISSFSCVQSAYLTKHLMIKERAIASLTATVISGCIGIFMAFKGFAYWGIATQTIAYSTVVVICMWYFSPWRPSFKFSIKPIIRMFAFSFKLLVTSIFTHINNNIFSVILGRIYNAKEVGNYSQANKWNNMGSDLISNMISGVSRPVLAGVSDEKERQLRIFRKMIRFAAFCSFPAMFGLALVAPEFITVAITDKWIDSAQIMRILCIGGAFLPISGLFSSLVISNGKSDTYMVCTVILGVLQTVMLILMKNLGIKYMLCAYTALNIIWVFVWNHAGNRLIGYSAYQFIKDISPYIAISAAIMFITYFCTKGISNVYILLTVRIVLAASLYCIVMWSSKATTFSESVQYLISMIKRNVA